MELNENLIHILDNFRKEIAMGADETEETMKTIVKIKRAVAEDGGKEFNDGGSDHKILA